MADGMAQIAEARQKLRAREILERQQADMAAMQAKHQIEQLKLRSSTQAEGAEAQLKSAEDRIKLAEREAQTKQRAQQQGQKEAQARANEPILNAPQVIPQGGIRPDMETMRGIGPGMVAPQQQPQQATPGAMQGGDGGYNVAPYLERERTTTGVQRNEFGGIPTTTVEYEREPNVLSAAEAGRLNMALAQDKQKSYDLYLDRLAQIGHYAKTPGQRKAFQREVQNLVGENPDALRDLEMRLGVVAADANKTGLQHPTEVYDPKSPTGTRLIAQDEAVGRPGLRLESSRARGQAEGSAMGNAIAGALAGLMPSKPTVNALQTRQVNATNALARTRQIRSAYRPEFTQIPDQMFADAANYAERMGISLGAKTSELVQGISQFKQNVNENLTSIVFEQSGKQTNEREATRLAKTVPNMEDGRSAFEAKLNNFYAKQIAATVRNQFLILNGLGTRSIGEALDAMPELEFTMGPPGAPDPGYDRTIQILDEAQTSAEMALRKMAAEQGVTIDGGKIKQQAIRHTAEQFGLGEEEVQFLLGD